MASLRDWQDLVGKPCSTDLSTQLKRLARMDALPVPEVKAYPDVVYHNYHSIGVSLCLVGEGGKKLPKDLNGIELLVDSVDLYNPAPPPATSSRPNPSRPTKPAFRALPSLPLELKDGKQLTPLTTGKDFVEIFGEPSKKGGGTGWVDIWLEWEGEGMQVELRDPKGDEVITDEAKKKGLGGPWDRAGSWVWGVIKLFQPPT